MTTSNHRDERKSNDASRKKTKGRAPNTLSFEIDNTRNLADICGSHDRHLAMIEQALDVYVVVSKNFRHQSLANFDAKPHREGGVKQGFFYEEHMTRRCLSDLKIDVQERDIVGRWTLEGATSHRVSLLISKHEGDSGNVCGTL